MHASYNKLSKEFKNGIGILVLRAVFKFMDQNSQKMFWSITQEPLGLPKF